MKRIYLFVCLLFYVNFSYGLDLITGDQEWNTSPDLGIEVGADDVLLDDLTIGEADGINTGYLIFNGNLIDSDGTSNKNVLIVNPGSTLIVYGDLTLENTNTTLLGNVIVTGNVTLKNTDMIASSNLVVGGTLASGGGNLNGVTGDVYLLDPTVNPNPPALPSEPLGIEDMIGEDPSLVTEIEETIATRADYVWNGSVGSWSVLGNWDLDTDPVTSPTALPGVLDDVIISSGTVTISGNIVVGSINIETNGTLVVSEGSTLSVVGDVVINGTFNVNNNPTTPASVIVNGTVTGNATVTWSSLATTRWWYMGYSVITASNLDLGTGGSSYVYDNAGLSWVSGAGTGGMDAVAFKVPDGGFSYSGELYNVTSDNFSVTQVSGKYQTFANPFPSFLDLKAVYDAGVTGFESSFYIYTDAGTNATYNASSDIATGDISQYIAPGQSVWVLTNAASSQLTVSKSFCSHQSSISLKGASSVVDRDEIRLKLRNSNTNDEALILFEDFGSELFTKYDSEKKMVGGSKGNLYTIKDEKYAVINSMPTIQGTEIIPLGYKVSESGMADFTISVNDLSGFDATASVYLEDLDAGVTIDLRQEQEYTFTPLVPQSDERFVIRIAQVTTDIDKDDDIISNRNVLVYVANQKATVRVTNELVQKANKKIELYNLMGQLVSQYELNDIETEVSIPQANTVYIIKVSLGNSSYQQKVVTK